MLYDQPCRFPADDPDRRWFVMTGRSLSQFEAKHWYAVLVGGRKRLLLIGFAVSLLFAMMSVIYTPKAAVESGGAVVALLLIVVAIVILSITTAMAVYDPKRQAMRRFSSYAADTARHERGDRIEFFTGHLSVTSLRGVRRMPFADVVTCVETYNGFALCDETGWIILRSQDMTAAEVQFIRDYLTERLDPQVMMCRSRAVQALVQPLPISQNYPEPVCLTSAEIPFEQSEFGKREKTRRKLLLFACNASLSILVAVMFAAVFTITAHYLVDLAIFCAAWVAGSAVVTWLLSKLFFRNNKSTLQLRFETEGLRLTVGDSSRFIPKEQVWITITDSMVKIRLIHGEPFSIPLGAVQDVTVLKALIGVV